MDFPLSLQKKTERATFSIPIKGSPMQDVKGSNFSLGRDPSQFVTTNNIVHAL